MISRSEEAKGVGAKTPNTRTLDTDAARIEPANHYGDGVVRDPYWARRVKTNADLLRPYFKPGGRLLEVGCYVGDLAEFLPDDLNLVGYDYDSTALEQAASRGYETHQINLDRDPLELEGKFDYAVCTEVLEHLVEPHRVLHSIAKCLKPDGKVVISLPNENTIYHRLMALFGVGVDMCAFELYKHLHFPTVRQAKNFVGTYFDLEQVSYYVNPRAEGSRIEKLGPLLMLMPNAGWDTLAKVMPGLFARGTIMLGTPKNPLPEMKRV